MLAEGSGPPVLLLHGSGPGTTAAAWAPLIAALAPHHRVIAPDLLGFGSSPKPEPGRSLRSAWTAQVLDLVDSLGIDSFAVVGNSAGGAIALSLACARPSAVTPGGRGRLDGASDVTPRRARRAVELRPTERGGGAGADRADQLRPGGGDAGRDRGAPRGDARAAVVSRAVPGAAPALGRRPRPDARGARRDRRAGAARARRAGPHRAAARQLPRRCSRRCPTSAATCSAAAATPRRSSTPTNSTDC